MLLYYDTTIEEIAVNERKFRFGKGTTNLPKWLHWTRLLRDEGGEGSQR